MEYRTTTDEPVTRVKAGPGLWLEGHLLLPVKPDGMIVYAHGSGSSRFSPHHRFIAHELHKAGFGTLLFDLLTGDEERKEEATGYLRFNIDLLSNRLMAATDWLKEQELTRPLPLGYLGVGTASAAALVAAQRRPEEVKAIVSFDGRPDLAGEALDAVETPTLFIVGSKDVSGKGVLEHALSQLPSKEKRLDEVPDVSQLYEKQECLEQAAHKAMDWFERFVKEHSKIV